MTDLSPIPWLGNPIQRSSNLRNRLYNCYKQSDSNPTNFSPPTQKDNVVANKFRIEGHSHFITGHFINAIDSYNKSLCFSEINGDTFNMSMAYGHRAEAYFKMDLYAECLSSIELALAHNYPTKHVNRMLIMQTKCQEKLYSNTSVEEVVVASIKLSHTPNEKIPFVIEGLRLEENEEFGRCIITEKNLKVGDVIAMEESYLTSLHDGGLYQRCSHCLSDQRHALFPCSFCTKSMFCSQKCEKEAWNQYHRYECSLNEDLLALEPAVRLATRALLVGLNIFMDFEALKKFLSKLRRVGDVSNIG